MAEQLSDDKRQAILQAARKRFAYYGFTKVTMDEIAADVLMGKASLYYYFSTKESLFHAVLSQEKDHFLVEIQRILHKDLSASEKLKEYVEKRFELFRELVNLSALSFNKTADIRSIFSELFSGLESEELKIVQQVLHSGKRSGEFRVSNMEQTARLIQHTLQGLRLRVVQKAQGARLEEEVYADLKQEGKLLIEVMLQGILKRT